MLVASAIKLTSGEVYIGKRHSDCFHNLIELNRKTNKYSEDELMKLLIKCMQGFINSSLHFLTREEAAIEAFECKQIDYIAKLLLSEDLW